MPRSSVNKHLPRSEKGLTPLAVVTPLLAGIALGEIAGLRQSAAAANGRISNDAYVGLAPNANVVNLRVLDRHGVGTVSGLLAALDWLAANRAAYNVRVVNLSLGTAAIDSYRNDPVCMAVRRSRTPASAW